MEGAHNHPPPPTRQSLGRGTQIGRYVVLDTIGGGGMGEVFSAYDPELDRRVALKLLRGDLAQTERARGRLLREARALAKLAHPHVVAVHDVGVVEASRTRSEASGGETTELEPEEAVLPNGSVFLAMEFVRGDDLAGWLAAERRDWRDIVGRFRQAGEGLAAAHAAGLLHRDFKPSNVLVGDDGRVRVADFGLARPADVGATMEPQDALGSKLPTPSGIDAGSPTATGSLLGTPAYMPPEQLAGGEIDARADQFAFCAAFFEALYGRLPFGGPVPTRVADMLAGRLREPPRGTKVPVWLHRVVVRGLAGDPAERWPSMRDLLDRLARRPRRRQLTAVALVLAGSAAAVATLRPWHADPCSNAADALDSLWSPAVQSRLAASFDASELPYAERLWQETRATLDRWAETWRSMRVDTCSATWVRGEQSPRRLDLRTDCLDRSLGDFEALIGLLDGATPSMVERAPTAASQLEPIDACAKVEELETVLPLPEDVEARARVARLDERTHRVRQLFRLGEHQTAWVEAQALLEEFSLRSDAASPSIDHPPVVARALLTSGLAAQSVEQLADAEELFLAGSMQADRGRVDRERARGLLALAEIRRQEPAEAFRWIALADAAAARVDDSFLTVQRDFVAAQVHVASGDLDAALAAARRTVAAAEAYPNGRALLIQSRGLLLTVLRLLDRKDEILPQLDELLQAQTTLSGPDHPQVMILLLERGETLIAVGQPDEAVDVLEDAAQRIQAFYGADSYASAVASESLAAALSASGELDRAETLLRAAIPIYDGLGEPGFARQTGSRHNLATVLWAGGRLGDAEELMREVLAARIEHYGRPHLRLVPVETMLGRLLLERGDLSAALELLASARRESLEVYPQENTKTLHAGFAHGMALIEAGRKDEGVDLIRSLAPFVRADRSERWIVAFGDWAAAVAAATTGDRDRARTLAEQAISSYTEMRSEGARQRAAIERWMARGLPIPTGFARTPPEIDAPTSDANSTS